MFCMTMHGERCEDRSATEIVFMEQDGTTFPAPIAEPVLPCKNTCSVKVQGLFKEAGHELKAYQDQNQDS